MVLALSVLSTIVGSCARKILLTARGSCRFEKVKLHPSHSLATKGAVPAVDAFTFCVGLAWLARCVLPLLVLFIFLPTLVRQRIQP